MVRWKTAVSPIAACNIGPPALCMAITNAACPLGGGVAEEQDRPAHSQTSHSGEGSIKSLQMVQAAVDANVWEHAALLGQVPLFHMF